MTSRKKEIRKTFRKTVFERDGFTCVVCKKKEPNLKALKENGYNSEVLDAHHITNRNEMKNGGYVKENGVSLCKDCCHLKAEEYLQGVVLHNGFSPEELYVMIGSSLSKAKEASDKL